MSARKATLLRQFSPIVLLVLLLCVLWLLIDEWSKVRVHRSVSDEPRKPVAARSFTNQQPQTPAGPEPRIASANQTPAPKRETWPLARREQNHLIAPTRQESDRTVEYTVRLPDGRELTFGGLTWGTEHKYTHHQPPVKPAKTPALPKPAEPETRTVSIKTTSPSLVAWLHCRSSRGTLLQADFISLVDDKGIEGELSKPSAIFNAAESETVGAWEISNFPRRDATIGIRLYSRDTLNKFHRMAEFWAANPAPQKYPVWSSEQLPVVKRNADTEYWFLNMFPDQPLAPHVPLQIQSGDEEGTGQWSTCVFKVRTASRPTPQWKVESIALSDATSNVLAPENVHFTKVGDYLVFAFNGAFWSSETSGKLRAEFTRTWGFSPDELITFTGLPAPSANRRLALNMQKKIGNFVLQVKELTHHRPPILMEQAYWNMELTAGPIPETPGVHASIVEVTDQTGRSIGPGISHKLPTGGRSFLFHTAPGSKTLNITFAVQRSQIVEFAPALRRDNALQANQQLGIPFDQFQQARAIPR